jgi:hypothetical protein
METRFANCLRSWFGLPVILLIGRLLVLERTAAMGNHEDRDEPAFRRDSTDTGRPRALPAGASRLLRRDCGFYEARR